MSRKTKDKSHMWTKQEIKKILSLWDSSTPEELAESFNVKKTQLMYIILKMRQAGIKLAKKHKNGYLSNLIQEVLQENKK